VNRNQYEQEKPNKKISSTPKKTQQKHEARIAVGLKCSEQQEILKSF